MSCSISEDDLNQAWLNLVQMGDLERFEDNIPYICDSNLPNRNGTSSTIEHMHNQSGFNCLHPLNLKTHSRFQTEISSCGSSIHWQNASDLVGSQPLMETADLPSQYQRLIQSESTSMQQPSFTIHHKGHSGTGQPSPVQCHETSFTKLKCHEGTGMSVSM